jgi:glycosyltransferase involved in cell wall biosynthesis
MRASRSVTVHPRGRLVENTMKVFMLGWEFPPFISGGLGTACYGLTKAMSQIGTEVIFVLPRSVEGSSSDHVRVLSPTEKTLQKVRTRQFHLSEFEHVRFHAVDTVISAYQTPETYRQALAQREAGQAVHVIDTETERTVGSPASGSFGDGAGPNYGGNLMEEVNRYARIAAEIASEETFDVVHAHDWMTFPAGMAVSALTGKPLVVHVHSTEFDRSGEHVNQQIYDIERRGVHAASKVIAVSHLTRSILLGRYGAAPEKVEVVYNAIDANGQPKTPLPPAIRRSSKIVLFLGRITMQKGPEYFLAAARKVLDLEEDVVFVMAGSGDQVTRTIERAAEMGIGHKVLFTGFLRGDDVARVFKMADLYVMPSVSEPFGLAPLEALCHDTPVLISKQSGVAEVLQHVLKVDFWDINEMANKIVAVLRHPPLRAALREHGSFEVRRLSWKDAARRCEEIYRSIA